MIRSVFVFVNGQYWQTLRTDRPLWALLAQARFRNPKATDVYVSDGRTILREGR